jgi:brefeldin A-resistance guanine nucleotide exchange factor 1
MSSSGYLVPASEDPSQEKLWIETWKRLDRFLPDLRKELDMDMKEKPAAAVKEITDLDLDPGNKVEGDPEAVE